MGLSRPTQSAGSSDRAAVFQPTKCQGRRVGSAANESTAAFRNDDMRPALILRSRALSALLLALICASPARAEPIDAAADEPQQMDDEAVPQLGDEPLDLSTPEQRGGKATIPLARPGASTGWDAKVGVDYRKPSIPAAEFQPGELTAGAIPDQSIGVAWASVTAPGLDSPLGWDKTAIETRLDPAQEQGRLGATLSRSVPVGESFAVTLQNGYSVTRTHPDAAAPAGAAQSWATNQALRFNVLPTDTSLSLGAAISSTDDKWLRTLSAEQKLFGGPLSVTGSVSETASGDTAKSLRAGFKRTW
jgi:hypothetical protein